MKCMFTPLLVVAQVCIATGVPTFLMSGIKVVSVCPDTTRRGFVQPGLINRKFGAVPDRP